MNRPARLPVYLLTGYLGSGKTSLLKAWLSQAEFKDAALIINELGEVGLDNQLLASASESASLIANACVCCTGLPGLEEAMEELFWARLHKRIAQFPCLVIETTGLAEPAPVVQAMQSSELLRERYQLAGVITCLSAATADAVLGQHAEARAQLTGTDLLIVTKADLVYAEALGLLQQRLAHQLAHLNSRAKMMTSAHASLTAAQMLQSLRGKADKAAHAHAEKHPGAQREEHAHKPTHQHEHAAHAYWWPLPDVIDRQQLLAQIQSLQLSLGPALLRIKGRVLTEEGHWLLQMAPFELAPALQADTQPQNSDQMSGLTVIVALPLSQAQSHLLQGLWARLE
jgi:G3E family GTPase